MLNCLYLLFFLYLYLLLCDIRQLCEKSFEFNKPAFCFIDIEKAFDNVRLKHVMNVLVKDKIPSYLINLIHDMYTLTTVPESKNSSSEK